MTWTCPNCNGTGPFLEMVVIQIVDKDGQPHRTEDMGKKFYMCVSDGDDHDCRAVNTQEELTA